MAYESFRSWQSKSIEQKQTASALMFGISAAALGFLIALVSDAVEYIGIWSSIFFHLTTLALLASVASAVLFTLNRVGDFDLTAKIAREREKNLKSNQLAGLRVRSKKLGLITKKLYAAQIVSFLLGILFLLVFVVIEFNEVLYSYSHTWRLNAV